MKALVLMLALLTSLAALAAAAPQEADSPAAGSDSARPSPSTRASDERRRDPFVSIVVKREAAGAPVQLPPGKPGLVIGQLQVLGIVRSIDNSWIAVVDNKTNRAYFLRERDKVYNGSVSRITADSVAFLENVTGSAGERRTREVVKRLAP